MHIAFAICSISAAILMFLAYQGRLALYLYGRDVIVGEKYWPVLITTMLTSCVVGCILSVA